MAKVTQLKIELEQEEDGRSHIKRTTSSHDEGLSESPR